MRRAIASTLLVLTTACTAHLPNADETVGAAALEAPYPTLERLPNLLAQADTGSTIVADTADFEARVARLKARANALRGRSVIDGQTRLRLARAVAAQGF